MGNAGLTLKIVRVGRARSFRYRVIGTPQEWTGGDLYFVGMGQVRELLRVRPWGLTQSRMLAHEIGDYSPSLRALVGELFGEDVRLRKRAADVVRRITDEDATPLERYADELAGLLESLPMEESQTRWHLALAVSRVAHTRAQRLRAARTLGLMVEDESNALRCAAMEGIATLALREPSLRDEAEALVEHFLWNGTPAMKARARHMRKRLNCGRKVRED